MKTLYFECNMGAAGDMLMAALLELHDNPQEFLNKLNNIGIPNALVTAEKSIKCGINGTLVRVAINGHEEESHHDHHDHSNHDHSHNDHVHHDHVHHEHEEHNHPHDHHHHNNFHDIEHLIGHLNVSDTVKKNVHAVYGLIAEAESNAHNVPIQQIHFHEVGNMDAVADITGVCMLIEELAPEIILASPINTGSGNVRCAHGILPVPAPATAYILQNIPIYSDKTAGELCTPTGAALLKHFVRKFCSMPVITIEKTGYGMGKKDFDKMNCVRVYAGNVSGLPCQHTAANEEVTELVCNLDDMSPEAVAFAQQFLLEEGALDVWTAPIGMKKGRQGLLFTCLCRNEVKDKMVSLIFKHTTTLGIRENSIQRYVLEREQSEVQTKYGTIRIKTAYGFGVKKSKPEYEDIARIVREKGISIQDVLHENFLNHS